MYTSEVKNSNGPENLPNKDAIVSHCDLIFPVLSSFLVSYIPVVVFNVWGFAQRSGDYIMSLISCLWYNLFGYLTDCLLNQLI